MSMLVELFNSDFEYVSLIYSADNVDFSLADWMKMARGSKTFRISEHVNQLHDEESECKIYDYSAGKSLFPILTFICPKQGKKVEKIFELEIHFQTFESFCYFIIE